jgi:ATP-dependent 26S proteasome regulatory subunit
MEALTPRYSQKVYNMSLEDPGSASFAGIGGLNDQVRELREVIELPLMNPELFEVRFSKVKVTRCQLNGSGIFLACRYKPS